MFFMIIDGKKTAQQIKDEVKIEVEELKKKKGITPGLAVVLVGENSASQVYVAHKQKACLEVGINSFEHILDDNIKEQEVLELIYELNHDDRVHGILIQLPLPELIDSQKIILAIDPKKDVDGFHPMNLGKLIAGLAAFVPCTPAGIIELLKRNDIQIEGKHCVVIGRSNIVGKPVSLLLQRENGTVTMCHSRTEFLEHYTKQADILVAAAGKEKIITADMVKEGAVVIDVGINRNEEGKLVGDVDFDGIKDKVSYITPVPGGVGPMTIAMLMKNCLKAAKDNQRV